MSMIHLASAKKGKEKKEKEETAVDQVLVLLEVIFYSCSYFFNQTHMLKLSLFT